MERVKVEIKTEQEMISKFEQMAHTLHNLRFWTKYWERHYGYEAKRKKDYWQAKADKILDELGLTLHNNSQAVKLIKGDDGQWKQLENR